MWYTNKVLFVHAPRTGGDWLTRWACSNLPAVSVDLHWLKHLTRAELLARIPELAGLVAFTIFRDEAERVASFVRHCRGFTPTDPPSHTHQWADLVAASLTLPEPEFVARYVVPGTAYRGDDVREFVFATDLPGCVAWLMAVHGLS
jgi:tellurite resistance-related uncharacterized protein